MSLLRSAMRQAYTLDSAVCPVLSPTHPHAAYLIVTGLYPETQGWLTMVDSQVCRATLCFPDPGDTVLSFFFVMASILRWQQALAHAGFVLSA